jgi:hypothetical protein
MSASQKQVDPPVTVPVAAGFGEHPVPIEIPHTSLGRPLREVVHEALEEQRSGARGASHLRSLLAHGSVVWELGGNYHASDASAEDILGLTGRKGNQNQRAGQVVIRALRPQRGGGQLDAPEAGR